MENILQGKKRKKTSQIYESAATTWLYSLNLAFNIGTESSISPEQRHKSSYLICGKPVEIDLTMNFREIGAINSHFQSVVRFLH
ncbi:Hypothetical predicted protein [Octopus vulgaris]|uniref:Uncharacterized protein n=1 Tax=Octopus vulgaris TaxID=6645 RepID=A0AA36F0R0_OCTVU|nr:Hypothetical predicted protein [Octopus vulgaris]